VINFLAPADDDRFFATPSGPHNLRFLGTLPGPLLRMEDGWQRIRATLHAPNDAEFWVAPIETVSESEGGFERVYQGSQILLMAPRLVELAFVYRAPDAVSETSTLELFYLQLKQQFLRFCNPSLNDDAFA
jgi:hypothetical protein